MADYPIPKAGAAIVDGRGAPTREWYNFFRTLLGSQAGEDVDAEIQALAERVSALEAEHTTSFTIQGLGSVVVHGSPQSGIVQISLCGDLPNPGASLYYGTNAAGEQGWHALEAAAVTFDPTTSGLTATDVQAAVDEISAGGGVPYFIPDGKTFSVAANKQALFAIPIELDGTASLVVDGHLVEVA